MHKNIIYSSIAILFLNACGGGSSSTEEKVESVEEVQTTIEKAGFSLTSLAPASSTKMQKTNPTSVSIAYSDTQKVDITADKLYLITDSEQNEVFATIDADALFDSIEQSQNLVMYHNGSTPSSGYVNLNTIKTNANATTKSILEEIQNAFAQITLNNPTTLEKVYTTGDDVNITYQTALKNQDESFECGGEVVVIDAQQGYSTLHDIQNEVNCTLGEAKIPLDTVALNSLEQITSMLSYQNISPKIFDNNGSVETGQYKFDISSLLDELNISKEQISGLSANYSISLKYGEKTHYFDNPIKFITFTNTTAENRKISPLLTIKKYVEEVKEKKNREEKMQKGIFQTIGEYALPEVTVLYETGVQIETEALTQTSIEFSLNIKNSENVKSVEVTNSSNELPIPQSDDNYKEEGLTAGTAHTYSVVVLYNDGRILTESVTIRTVAPTPTPSTGGGDTGGGGGGRA